MTAADKGASHWDEIYSGRRNDELSWYQGAPDVSLRLLTTFAARDGSVIDVGAGSSPLAAALLDAGWRDVTVLDISDAALAVSRDRLGKHGTHADRISFVVADVLTWNPPRRFDAWHDRAVFHFLVDPVDRVQYARLAARAVASGGILVIGTFAADGPTECSGLPTARYGPEQLAQAFAPDFVLEHTEREQHTTPGGAIQPFTWVVLRSTPPN
jgi:SAM-dependent methyltransferase